MPKQRRARALAMPLVAPGSRVRVVPVAMPVAALRSRVGTVPLKILRAQREERARRCDVGLNIFSALMLEGYGER